MTWYTEGAKVAPIAGALLAQTPVTPGTVGTTVVIVAASIGFLARLEVVDAVGTVVFSQVIAVPSGSTIELNFDGLDTAPGGLIRVVAVALVAGVTVQASVNL